MPSLQRTKARYSVVLPVGGGSSMGYKLAGFDVVGCNEIDRRVMDLYKKNHHPRYAFLEPIQTFKERTAFPDALYSLDILDGSPPCSTFTIAMARTRQETWGKEKRFREGQAEQVLDRFDILMSNAVGIFLRQVVLQRGISFEMKLPDFCFCNPWDF